MSTKVSGCMSVLRIPLPLLCVVCSSSNSKMLSVGLAWSVTGIGHLPGFENTHTSTVSFENK